jgi:hypothetical protein
MHHPFDLRGVKNDIFAGSGGEVTLAMVFIVEMIIQTVLKSKGKEW